jgi:hypothetical protein
LGLVAYFVSRLIVLNGSGKRANTTGKDMMQLFAYVALVLTAALLVCSILCLTNFNHGLKRVNRGIKAERETYMLHSEGYSATDQWPGALQRSRISV